MRESFSPTCIQVTADSDSCWQVDRQMCFLQCVWWGWQTRGARQGGQGQVPNRSCPFLANVG